MTFEGTLTGVNGDGNGEGPRGVARAFVGQAAQWRCP